jgi:1,4-alpha-glucan branching enzyme
VRAPAPDNDGMGSLLRPDGSCRFRVWAPNARRVQVMGDFTNWNSAPLDLASEGSSGNWSADQIPAQAGQMYKYLITNRGGPNNDNSQVWERTDARALQVESSSAASAGYVVAPFPSARQPFRTPAFQDFILYQMHVGSFAGRNDGIPVRNNTATFVDLISKLDYIRGLGFNAIAPLPISDSFTDVGGAGEGYGPSDMYASEDKYATRPDRAVAELIQLIDAAHARGLAVILDVVYNHAATIDNRYWRYDGNTAGNGGIYFESGHNTHFGSGFAMWKQEIKDFFLDNARMYLRDYRVDGLRFDAVQFIQPDAVQQIVQQLRREFPDKYLIAEYNPGDSESAAGPVDPYGVLGFCATWDLSSPGETFALLNGDNVVNRLLGRIGGFSDPNPWHSVVYLTGSHDQIYGGMGNSGLFITQRFGGRGNGWARAKARLVWALNAALPGTPMLFMGTEGHLDGYWDPDTKKGDRRIDWLQIGDSLGSPMQRMVRDVNNIRWAHPALRSPAGNVVHRDFTNQVVAFKRYTFDGDLLLVVVNAGDSQWTSNSYGVDMQGESGRWKEIFNSQSPDYGGIFTVGNFNTELQVSDGRLWINLPAWSVLMFQKL